MRQAIGYIGKIDFGRTNKIGYQLYKFFEGEIKIVEEKWIDYIKNDPKP